MTAGKAVPEKPAFPRNRRRASAESGRARWKPPSGRRLRRRHFSEFRALPERDLTRREFSATVSTAPRADSPPPPVDVGPVADAGPRDRCAARTHRARRPNAPYHPTPGGDGSGADAPDQNSTEEHSGKSSGSRRKAFSTTAGKSRMNTREKSLSTFMHSIPDRAENVDSDPADTGATSRRSASASARSAIPRRSRPRHDRLVGRGRTPPPPRAAHAPGAGREPRDASANESLKTTKVGPPQSETLITR